MGEVDFNLSKSEDAKDKDGNPTYNFEDYNLEILLGKAGSLSNGNPGLISLEKLSELTILNSTDYLRAIYDFEQLVNPVSLKESDPSIVIPDEIDYDGPEWATVREMCIKSLIMNSILRSGRYKARLRYLVKAKINLDRLDDNFAMAKGNDATKSKIGEKYINDLWKSYHDIGVLGGITKSDE